MIVSNPNTRINKQDSYGVNAFWVAAFYGNIDVSVCKTSSFIDNAISHAERDRYDEQKSEWIQRSSYICQERKRQGSISTN